MEFHRNRLELKFFEILTFLKVSFKFSNLCEIRLTELKFCARMHKY